MVDQQALAKSVKHKSKKKSRKTCKLKTLKTKLLNYQVLKKALQTRLKSKFPPKRKGQKLKLILSTNHRKKN